MPDIVPDPVPAAAPAAVANFPQHLTRPPAYIGHTNQVVVTHQGERRIYETPAAFYAAVRAEDPGEQLRALREAEQADRVASFQTLAQRAVATAQDATDSARRYKRRAEAAERETRRLRALLTLLRCGLALGLAGIALGYAVGAA